MFTAAHVSIYFVSPYLESQLDRKGTAVIVINVYAVLVALLIPALLSATPVRWLLTRQSANRAPTPRTFSRCTAPDARCRTRGVIQSMCSISQTRAV